MALGEHYIQITAPAFISRENAFPINNSNPLGLGKHSSHEEAGREGAASVGKLEKIHKAVGKLKEIPKANGKLEEILNGILE